MHISKTILFLTVATCVAIVAIPANAAKKAAVSRAAPAAAIARAIADAPHDARYERGFICYTDHYHYGSSGSQPSRPTAEAAAASNWSSFVDFEYGSAWSSFRKAGSKKMTCTAGSGGWDCSVEARPCR